MPARWFISSYLHMNRVFITGEAGLLPFFQVDGTNWILLELVCETSSVEPLSALWFDSRLLSLLQQDVSEFTHKLLDWLEDAFQLAVNVR